MQTLNWRGLRLIIQSHNVQLAPHQLELRQCRRDDCEPGPPVLMLAGFLGTVDSFFPHKGEEGGLAPFLASLGYDVYIAELRGRGKSWPATGAQSDWGLHEAIVEDIPAHLQTVDKLRPGEAQFWLGEGLGGVLLTAAYARLEALSAPLLGLVHLGAARRRRLDSPAKRWRYRVWASALGASRLLRGYAALPGGDPARRETRTTLVQWKEWLSRENWLDPLDDFDYYEALQHKELPASLYLANRPAALWGNIDDCRRWVDELGPHDARLLTVGKAQGNRRNYSQAELLQHPTACEDHYLQLQAWLEEQARAPLRTPLAVAASAQ